MKKKLMILILFFLEISLFAQKIDIVNKIPFNKDINYWENYDAYEGGFPSISNLIVDEDKFIFKAGGNDTGARCFFEMKDGVYKIANSEESYIHNRGITVSGTFPNGYLYGYICAGSNHNKIDMTVNYKNVEYIINTENDMFSEGLFTFNSFYCVDNILFFITSQNNLVSIELVNKNKFILRNVNETLEFLNNDKIEFLNIEFRKNKKNKITRICIGSYSLKPELDGINYWKICNDTFVIDQTNYSHFKNLNDSKYGYELIGYDNKGFHYFIKNNEGKFILAVMDVMSKKIIFYDNFDEYILNPLKDKFDMTMLSSSWFVDKNGNIYFATIDLNNREYQIKKINNCWYKDFSINENSYGSINSNHIEIYSKSTNKSDIVGYAFENDIVIKTEFKGKYVKIKSLTGFEGWIENRYID